MKMKYLLLLILMSCLGIQAGYAQEDEDEDAPPDMDFSAFSGDLEVEEGAKRFCSSKILGLTPQRLISVGYDYQLPYTLTTNEPTDFSNDIGVSATHGLRIATLFPIVSKNNIIFSLGFNYLESQYVLDDPAETAGDALGQSLSRSGALRSAGLAVTIFKPLNDRHFLIYSANHDLNGDYWLDELQPLSYLKHSITGIFGWRKNERKQIGFGISRTYRAGDLNYIPIIFYNYTHSSEKWGIETVFPARFHYRRSFSSRSLLRVGYELEGNSYRLQNRRQQFGPSEDIELRRSELRFQLSYEKSLSGFIWVALQAGYRYNYRYNVDDGEFFRGFFGDQEYLSENTLTNPLYFNVSLNLVSP